MLHQQSVLLDRWRVLHPSRIFTNADLGDWWYAGDLSKLFQDTGAVTPATAVTNPVKLMRGQRGLKDFTSATDAIRPLLQKVTDGPYYLSFDGVDDIFLAGTTGDWNWLHDGTGGTIAVVASIAGTASINFFGTTLSNGTIGAYLLRNATGMVNAGIRAATANVVVQTSAKPVTAQNDIRFFAAMSYRTQSGPDMSVYDRAGWELIAAESTAPGSGASQFALRFPLTQNVAVMKLYAALAVNKELSRAHALGLMRYWQTLGLFR